MKIKEYVNRRNALFFVSFVAAFLMAYTSIKALYYSSSQREYYSHIVLIPLVSLYLLYQKRSSIFTKLDSRFRGNDSGCLDSGQGGNDGLVSSLQSMQIAGGKHSYFFGIPILLIGVLLYFGGQHFETQLNQNDFASILAASAVIFLNGAFIFCYGFQAFKAAMFPLLFLIFVIPIPSTLMDGIIYFLQVGSTEFTNLLFIATGVPFMREGFVFHMPTLSVEVAPQCSGIRSGLALFITCLLAGYMFLNTWWKKVILLIVAIPMTMFKNGIRIVTLTLLGTYVDPRILQSSLHREGGIPFFIVALCLMAPVLFFLRKTEKGSGDRGKGKG